MGGSGGSRGREGGGGGAAGKAIAKAGGKGASPAETATDLARVEASLGVKFAPAAPGRVLVMADMAKLDADLARDVNFYVAPGGTGAAIKGRYEDVSRFLDKARREGIKVETPRVTIADEDQSASVSDGRHRLATFRDMGLKSVPVQVDRASAAKFRRKYGP